MTVELGKSPPRHIEFTLDKKQLAAKPLPFRLFMELAHSDDGEVTIEVMGKILLDVVVYLDSGDKVFSSVEEVLDWDGQILAKLFNDVSRQVSKAESARKNLKASQR